MISESFVGASYSTEKRIFSAFSSSRSRAVSVCLGSTILFRHATTFWFASWVRRFFVLM